MAEEQIQKVDNSKEESYGAEEILNFASFCILALGIIAGLYLAANAESSPNATSQYVMAGLSIIGAIIQWAFAKVFISISRTLKEIKSKMK